LKYPDRVCRRMESQKSPIELLKYTQDQAIWKSMVVDVTCDRTQNWQVLTLGTTNNNSQFSQAT